MKFAWACRQLLAGKSVRRAAWGNGFRLVFNNNEVLVLEASGDRHAKVIHLADLKAIDWEAA
jgi:hypothetical protein